VFAVHPFPFLSQSLKGHFGEVWARALWDVANYSTICKVCLADVVDYHSKSMIWMGVIPTT
jgi:hypothetical protein